MYEGICRRLSRLGTKTDSGLDGGGIGVSK